MRQDLGNIIQRPSGELYNVSMLNKCCTQMLIETFSLYQIAHCCFHFNITSLLQSNIQVNIKPKNQ